MTDQHIETVNHLKKKLDKGVSFEKTMHILYKLQKIPISVKLLEETGIGYKLRELSKQEKNNDVGKTAKLLIMAWKQFLKNKIEEQTQEHQEDNEDSEESEMITSTNSANHQQQHRHDHHRHPKDHRHKQNYNSDSDNDANHQETFDDDDNEAYDVTPRSDKSEESVVSPQSSQHNKKKHKKKKKKSKENNSDEEIDKKERKKDKKRKHRENNANDERDSKRHKHDSWPKSTDNKCDKIINGDNSKPTHSQWLNQQPKDSIARKETSSQQNRFISSADDMFSSVLNMGDKVITSKMSGRTPVNNRLNSNETSTSMASSSSSNMDREIMQTLPSSIANRYDPSFYQYYQPTKPYNDSDKNFAMNMAGMKFKGRTQVYAGLSKVSTVPQVYRLQDICIKMLMNHVDKIYEVGDLPYFILKPVFAKCTVQQLQRIEQYNPQLLEDTDELWRDFCEKEFKNKIMDRKRFKSWREFYNYLVTEREEKLKNITRNISSKQRQAIPERKTQQIDLKTPREIKRRQISNTQFGFSSRSSASSSSSKPFTSINSMQQNKSKPAPLMKKLLQMRQKKFRR